MTLTLSPPYNPSDRVKHASSGCYGTVKDCAWSQQYAAFFCVVAFDAFKGRAYKVRADALDPAPKHVAFALISPQPRAELAQQAAPAGFPPFPAGRGEVSSERSV